MNRLRLRMRVVFLGLGIAAPVMANPELPTGTWVEITPPDVTTGAPETCIGQGVQIDPQSPSTVYWGNTPYNEPAGGLFKTTDGGSTWDRVATVPPAWQGASDHLDMPVHVRVDPSDGQHLYAVDGVRGSSNGFFVSHDGGENFVQPQGFLDALADAQIATRDLYDVATDPDNFNHLLVSFHSAWNWNSQMYGQDAGIMESTDGGDTWKAHPPTSGWGAGHAVKFLYDPASGVGDSNTWLLGTQGDGFWRTTNAGDDWTQVSDTDITHGGGTIYYASSGVLYASGITTQRSTNNGASWTGTGVGASWAIYGDGERLYSGGSFGANSPIKTSPESDGQSWNDYNPQVFGDGPYEMSYDSTNGILYASIWTSGLWALKVGEGTGVLPPPTGGGAAGGASSGGTGGTGGTGVAGGTGGTAPSGGAGSSGSAGSVLGSGGSAGSASAGSAGMTNSPMGATRELAPGGPGCACRTSPVRTERSGWLLALAAATLASLRRRRARAA